MKREIITTNDGSKTIHLPDWNESYHSKHGAVQEAQHVFIKSGLCEISKAEIGILEIGFGTGLNAMLTMNKAKETDQLIEYTGLEAYPVSIYFDAFGPRVQPDMWTLEIFQKLYSSMENEGVFVTYCAKGQVRRDLIEAGFKVEKIPGPPGKREMLRGRKI